VNVPSDGDRCPDTAASPTAIAAPSAASAHNAQVARRDFLRLTSRTSAFQKLSALFERCDRCLIRQVLMLKMVAGPPIWLLIGDDFKRLRPAAGPQRERLCRRSYPAVGPGARALVGRPASLVVLTE
jgi:hypothetical protein